MDNLNFKSIADLPTTEQVTADDYILAVQGGIGKRLPAGNFTGGGGGVDAIFEVTSSDMSTLTGTIRKGNYAELKEKYDSGEMPNVSIKLDLSAAGVPLLMLTALECRYDNSEGEVLGFVAAEGVLGNGTLSTLVVFIYADDTIDGHFLTPSAASETTGE